MKEKYMPNKKDITSFLCEYEACEKDTSKIKKLRPMTLEGCIVRVSDIIGYLGKDIDDACRLGMLDPSQIPVEIKETLGVTNDQIMNTIILDVIKNSLDKPYIQMSAPVFDQVVNLKKFNYTHIYEKATDAKKLAYYTELFHSLFQVYQEALEKEDRTNDIYCVYLQGMCETYILETNKSQMVIDYMAGMTDHYIQKQYIKYVKNKE